MDVFVNHYNRLFQTFIYQSLSSCLNHRSKKEKKRFTDAIHRASESMTWNLWRY